MNLKEAIQLLKKARIDSPETDAFLLAEHFCGIPKSAAKLNLDREEHTSELQSR